MWYKFIDGCFQRIIFVKSEVDNNLYYLVVWGNVFILVLYVDEFFLTGSLGLIKECKRELAVEFKMKDLG